MFHPAPKGALGAMLAALCAVSSVPAQEGPSDRTIDATERRTVIAGVLDQLKQNYVFPDTAGIDSGVPPGYIPFHDAHGFAPASPRSLGSRGIAGGA